MLPLLATMLVSCLWHLPAKAWNKLMHSINGNASSAETDASMEVDAQPTPAAQAEQPLPTKGKSW